MRRKTLEMESIGLCRGQVLLLGDDGRMQQMLTDRFGDYRLCAEENVMDGILRLSREGFDLVLLNAQALEDRLSAAVKSIRQVCPAATLLLYGEAYSEGFARRAMRHGADDYLIWPVPENELRDYLQYPYSRTQGADQSQSVRLLEEYQRLCQWAGQDKEVLVRQAERIIASVLGVASAHIDELIDGAESESSGSQGVALVEPEPAGISFALVGPQGVNGRMTLEGDGTGNGLNHALARELGVFVGSLLHLAQRCEGLRHLATVDELTGAYNRRYLEYTLRELIEQSDGEPMEIALLLFDIDDFKHYNDAYGHMVGDEVLKQVTQISRRCCRRQDIVARVGGDEFAVLFWDTGHKRKQYEHDAESRAGDFSRSCEGTTETAFFLSNRFRRLMRTSEFPAIGPEARGVLTISGGLAHFRSDGATAAELFEKADQALLAAKRSGKNQIYLVGQPGGHSSSE